MVFNQNYGVKERQPGKDGANSPYSRGRVVGNAGKAVLGADARNLGMSHARKKAYVAI